MSKLSARSLLVFSTAALAAIAASVLLLVNPFWAAAVAICGLFSASASVVLSARAKDESSATKVETVPASVELNAKSAAIDQMRLAAGRCEELQKQVHDIRNLVSSVVLDVDGLRELPTDADRDRAWLSLRADTTETLLELQRALDAPASLQAAVSDHADSASLHQASVSAKARSGVSICVDEDLHVVVRGGQSALVAAMVHLGVDASLAGRTTVEVECKRLARSVELRVQAAEWAPSQAVAAHWCALASNSGGKGRIDDDTAPLRVQFPLQS